MPLIEIYITFKVYKLRANFYFKLGCSPPFRMKGHILGFYQTHIAVQGAALNDGIVGYPAYKFGRNLRPKAARFPRHYGVRNGKHGAAQLDGHGCRAVLIGRIIRRCTGDVRAHKIAFKQRIRSGTCYMQVSGYFPRVEPNGFVIGDEVYDPRKTYIYFRQIHINGFLRKDTVKV